MHAAEDSESSDNSGVLSVVLSFNLHTNRVFYQLIWCEIDLSVAGKGRRVRVPGLGEFVATVDSEASDTESPRFEENTGVEALPDAPGRVGMTPMEDVEVEEVEEEDPDVHFKRKRQGGSRRKRVVKKSRRYTPTIIAEGELAAVSPPPALLVIKLSAQRQTIDKAVPDLGKISFILATCTYIFHTAHLFII